MFSVDKVYATDSSTFWPENGVRWGGVAELSPDDWDVRGAGVAGATMRTCLLLSGCVRLSCGGVGDGGSILTLAFRGMSWRASALIRCTVSSNAWNRSLSMWSIIKTMRVKGGLPSSGMVIFVSSDPCVG